ncbi:MAG: HIT domain-containing protein [Ignavibacteriales bacterium]|nr:HIT domain-containing protein [Ignavibacteriales bacterium]
MKGSEHAALLGEMIDAANKIAKDLGIAEDGFRLVFNCGNDGGQEVYHLHLTFTWRKKNELASGIKTLISKFYKYFFYAQSQE